MKKRSSAVVVVRSAKQWGEIVGEWQQSGQKAGDFCRARGLALKTFQWWRWDLISRHRGSQRAARDARTLGRVDVSTRNSSGRRVAIPAFIEVVSPAAIAVFAHRKSSGVEVVIEGTRTERRVRINTGFDAATLQRVVRLLEEV